MMKFVNVYLIDRRWGGPQEGGWWYNNYNCIETYPTREENTNTVVEFLKNEHEDKAHGDIYSVLGGREIEIMIEDRPSQSETTERPHYE